MKILYLSHQQENSGYGRSCRDFLKAIKTTGAEVASVPIVLGRNGNFYEDTEFKDIRNADCVINHLLPHYLSYNGNFKNIAICLNETLNLKNTDWKSYLDMMDEVWFPYDPIVQGIPKGIQIPHPIDITRYSQKYPKMNIMEADGTYKFYWIGEASKRKNLSSLITAYFLAFRPNDPVSLIIKVSKPGYSPQQIKTEIEDLINKIAEGLRLYPVEDYPRVFVIADNWQDEQICALHKLCDCYVNSSYGEALCYPMIDAMGFGRPVICPAHQAACYSKYGYMNIVNGTYEACYGQLEAFPTHFTGNEEWLAVNVRELSDAMKSEYNRRELFLNNLEELSYENVGNLILERLL